MEINGIKKELLGNNRDFVIEPFTQIPLELLQHPDYLIENRSKIVLYQYLCSRAVRKRMRKDPFDIYNRYYKDNVLACSIPMLDLAEKFGYKDTKIIRDWIKDLAKEGLLIVEKVKVPGRRAQNVYIVGIHSGGSEYLLIYYKYSIGQEKEIRVVSLPTTSGFNKPRYRGGINPDIGV